MPNDNSGNILPGENINFPLDGPIIGTDISRFSPFSPYDFSISTVGYYQILFQVNISEAGQLVVVLNGNEIAYTIVGKSNLMSQIVGMCIIYVDQPSILNIRNPINSLSSLEITPNVGGSNPVSAHLLITRLA
jgi:hypothetical protein